MEIRLVLLGGRRKNPRMAERDARYAMFQAKTGGLMTLEEKTALEELKRVLQERCGATSVVVYGSKARGDDSPDSDIDVMVVLEDYTPQIEAAVDEAVYEINLAHDCLISVVIFGRRELEEGPLGESPLYKRILAEGVPV